MQEKICIHSGLQENEVDTFWFTGFPVNLAISYESQKNEKCNRAQLLL